MKEVFNFWFNELTPEDWWKKDSVLDDLIRSRFGHIHDKAIRGELFSWRKTIEGRLSEIVILDQFSRNMFRGDPRSFLYDVQALTLAQECVFLGLDMQLDIKKRKFIYMPYMHSESLVIHEEAVGLFSQVGFEEDLGFEHRHLDILKRFDRYPHRNIILGRESTPEELEFLKGPNSSF